MAGLPAQSVAGLVECGSRHLDAYCDPAGRFAWDVYDSDDAVNELRPVDVTATALLDYPIAAPAMAAMFATDDNPYSVLRKRMQEFLNDKSVACASFEELPVGAFNDQADSPWPLMRAVLSTVDSCDDLTAVACTKILHRKRPRFVPLYDRHVRRFYGYKSNRPWRIWPLLHHDLCEHLNLVDTWRADRKSSDGRLMSRLRAMDIVIWHHSITGCAESPFVAS